MTVSAIELERALLSLDRLAAERILAQSREEMTPIGLAESVVCPALEKIGEGWEKGTTALSQVYMSGRICEEFIESILAPADQTRKSQPRLAIALLQDYHGLGKRMVAAVSAAVRAAGNYPLPGPARA